MKNKILAVFFLLSFSSCGIFVYTNAPLASNNVIEETKEVDTTTKFIGKYDADLNTNLEFIKKGIIAGRISLQDRAIFSLNINLEKKMGTLTLLEVEVDDDGGESIKRKTTTFTIEE